jgi:hypothetical protein
MHRLTVAFRVVFAPLLVLFLVFGIPLVGNFVVLQIGWSVDCGGNPSYVPPCYLFGKDISDIFGNYALTIVIAGALNPILFIAIIFRFLPIAIIIIWVSAIVFLWHSRRRIARELATHG